MDATRRRRTKDQARRVYYASYRQRRFAQHMGFAAPSSAGGPQASQLMRTDEEIILQHGDRGPYMLAEIVAIQQFILRAG
jgi:hypothetical protein